MGREHLPRFWQWTAVFVYALRQALCPSDGLVALMAKTVNGELGRSLNDRRRSRPTQLVRLPELLRTWVLG